MKRVPSDQHDRENAFGRSCARLRQRMSLTQQAMGRLLGSRLSGRGLSAPAGCFSMPEPARRLSAGPLASAPTELAHQRRSTHRPAAGVLAALSALSARAGKPGNAAVRTRSRGPLSCGQPLALKIVAEVMYESRRKRFMLVIQVGVLPLEQNDIFRNR
jgi:hypothetical protein